jgi:hypothetical protein
MNKSPVPSCIKLNKEMKFFLSCSLTLFSFLLGMGQATQSLPEFDLDKSEFEKHLQFLASDELKGRMTASEGERLAADYIVSQLESYGVKPAPGTDNYRQAIPFERITPPSTATLALGDAKYDLKGDLLILSGGAGQVKSSAVFAGHGWVDEILGHDDYKDLDVKGKIVFVLPGRPGSTNPMEMVQDMARKKEFAKSRGVAALIELYRMNIPWTFFKNYFGKERLDMASPNEQDGSNALIHGWLKEAVPNPIKDLEQGKQLIASITTAGTQVEKITAYTVVGFVEGSDPGLKEQYMVISAHYDHVGVGEQGGAPYTEQDSIFNGTRDNAMGTVALLAAAKALAAKAPMRSVVFLACTAEEMGLLGSKYYVENPLFPLDKTVFNLNNDGAGYNTTEAVTIIGLDKTSVNDRLYKAAEAFGLKILDDPDPKQNLYERSDNANFANKGIPAIDFAPGIKGMDDEVYKYYHQAADNPDSIDYDYLLQFCKAFAHTARLLADMKETPEWAPGQERNRN